MATKPSKSKKSYSEYEILKMVYMVEIAGMTQTEAAEAMVTRPTPGAMRKMALLKASGDWDVKLAYIRRENWKPHWRNDQSILNPDPAKAATKPAKRKRGRPRKVVGVVTKPSDNDVSAKRGSLNVDAIDRIAAKKQIDPVDLQGFPYIDEARQATTTLMYDPSLLQDVEVVASGNQPKPAEKFTLSVLITSIAWTAGAAFILGVSVGYNLLG